MGHIITYNCPPHPTPPTHTCGWHAPALGSARQRCLLRMPAGHATPGSLLPSPQTMRLQHLPREVRIPVEGQCVLCHRLGRSAGRRSAGQRSAARRSGAWPLGLWRAPTMLLLPAPAMPLAPAQPRRRLGGQGQATIRQRMRSIWGCTASGAAVVQLGTRQCPTPPSCSLAGALVAAPVGLLDPGAASRRDAAGASQEGVPIILCGVIPPELGRVDWAGPQEGPQVDQIADPVAAANDVDGALWVACPVPLAAAAPAMAPAAAAAAAPASTSRSGSAAQHSAAYRALGMHITLAILLAGCCLELGEAGTAEKSPDGIEWGQRAPPAHAPCSWAPRASGRLSAAATVNPEGGRLPPLIQWHRARVFRTVRCRTRLHRAILGRRLRQWLDHIHLWQRHPALQRVMERVAPWPSPAINHTCRRPAAWLARRPFQRPKQHVACT
jgi:hypothetical protein